MLWTDAIFWVAALLCAISQAAIVRSALRARATRPDGLAAPAKLTEVAWTVVPGFVLVAVLVATWRMIHALPPAGL